MTAVEIGTLSVTGILPPERRPRRGGLGLGCSGEESVCHSDNLKDFRPYIHRTGGTHPSYLGPLHNAVPLAVDPGNPLRYATPGKEVFREEQRRELELVDELNRIAAVRYPKDP